MAEPTPVAVPSSGPAAPAPRTAPRVGVPGRWSVSHAGARARGEILGFLLLSRLLVFASAVLVQLTGFPRPVAGAGFAARPLALLEVWDGRWYKTVAAQGYLLMPGRQSDPAFFPLLPTLLRLGHEVGLSYGTVGIVISNIAFGVGVLAFYELARTWVPEPVARRAAIYAAIFPMGFVFSMVYPEALAFCLVALAGLFTSRRAWGRAGVCAALATLARPEGVLLVVPLAVAVVRSWESLPTVSRGRAVAAALSPLAGLAGYSAYLWWSLGQPLAWTKAQAAWGRSFHVTGMYTALLQLESAARHHEAWLFRDGAFCLFYLLCLVAAWRAGTPHAWIVAGAAIVLLPLASGSFTSDARFGLLALPVYSGLAWVGRKRTVDYAIRALSVALLLAGVETLLLHWP